MRARDMMLQDLPGLYPGLTKAGVEHVVRVLEQPCLGRGLSLASELVSLAPVLAERLTSLTGTDLDDYARVLRQAAMLTLSIWAGSDEPPTREAIESGVAAMDE